MHATSSVRSPFPSLARAFAASRGFAPPPAPDARVASLRGWADAFAEATGDPHAGVAVARWMPRGTYELVEYAARSAATLGEALSTAAEFAPLMNDRLRMRVVEGADELRVEHWIEGEPGSLGRHFDEFAMATARRFIEEVAPGANVVRIEVVASDAREVELSDLLATPVRAGRERNAFVISRRNRDAPLTSAEPALATLLRRLSRRALEETSPGDLVTRVRLAVARKFDPAGQREPDVAVVARLLGLSVRTLERRLAEEGTSFDDVRDGYRRDLALRLLAQGTPLPMAARRLGFRSLRGFHRALSRWKCPRRC